MDTDLNLKAFQQLSYGLYVVCSSDGDKMNGQIANCVFQVTSSPPRIAVSLNKENLTHEFIQKSGEFSVSVLEESVPMKFIGLFGFKSGRDVDKLSHAGHEQGVTACPVVTEHTLSTMEAKVIGQFNVGTHTIFIGDVVSANVIREGTPLTYDYYHKVKRGKSPKNAPTYQESQP